MATFVIGDVQGCFAALMQLLTKIQFNPKRDKLIFCGDLVNRGGQSLAVLRWVYAHKNSCKVVLGNHDLALLAQFYIPKMRKSDNVELQRIFHAKDCQLLINWLRTQKLLIYTKKYNKVIVHAGIYPAWSLKRARKEAKKIEQQLLKKPEKLFNKMYGAKPNHWSTSLSGMDRARFVINSLTRMRFLYKNGGMNLKAKGDIATFPRLIPWFSYQPRKKIKPQIIFGHWSALGLFKNKNVICIDTGKVWGGELSALKLNKTIKKSKHIVQV
ncbi:Bis(5'-nucleosyl)-tetraphosphatase, symmetrical [hydrothermal vent metagenome]|uniref:bis(5'-nucleosyl)-tetraphosphatase (symmetrical) n=1 Tax=hydrothermal vent metagenome TaxID=652676 RepID=A0A3B0VYV9_9ZZZZ